VLVVLPPLIFLIVVVGAFGASTPALAVGSLVVATQLVADNIKEVWS